MRVAVTGATGLIGPAVIAELSARGVEVLVLSRDPQRAQHTLPATAAGAVRWDPAAEPAPADALRRCDAVVHLAGEPIAQRWSAQAKRAIRESRELGTRNLIAGLAELSQHDRPAALISSSAVGIYGSHLDEPLDEEAPHGYGFLAETCLAWEAAANTAREISMRVAIVRTGVVLSPRGGALAKMLPPFKMGVGGPVAGGEQYVSWIHLEDLARLIATAATDERWEGPFNATAPEPVTNRVLSKALGRALHRPALLPVPAAALHLLYGEMAEVITTGQRVLPAKALMLGFHFEHPQLQEALQSTLG